MLVLCITMTEVTKNYHGLEMNALKKYHDKKETTKNSKTRILERLEKYSILKFKGIGWYMAKNTSACMKTS